MKTTVLFFSLLLSSTMVFAWSNKKSHTEIPCHDQDYYEYDHTEYKNASLSGPGNFKFVFYKSKLYTGGHYCFTMTLPNKSRPVCWADLYKFAGDTKVEGRCDIDNDGDFEREISNLYPLKADTDWSNW